jgi:hypothetical protein
MAPVLSVLNTLHIFFQVSELLRPEPMLDVCVLTQQRLYMQEDEWFEEHLESIYFADAVIFYVVENSRVGFTSETLEHEMNLLHKFNSNNTEESTFFPIVIFDLT